MNEQVDVVGPPGPVNIPATEPPQGCSPGEPGPVGPPGKVLIVPAPPPVTKTEPWVHTKGESIVKFNEPCPCGSGKKAKRCCLRRY